MVQEISLRADVCRVTREIGFSHGNFPKWLQFGSLTFFKSLIAKVLFHLDCYSGSKNKFPWLFIRNQELVSEHLLLGADSVSDKVEELSSGAVPQG